jgi:hypothetical protein
MPARFTEPTIILCDRVHREAGTNKAHLQGLWNRLLAGGLPAGLTASVFVRFYLDPAATSVEVQLKLVRPNHQMEMLPKMRLHCSEGKCEADIGIQGMPILQVGRHELHLLVEGDQVTSTSFTVGEVSGANPSAN